MRQPCFAVDGGVGVNVRRNFDSASASPDSVGGFFNGCTISKAVSLVAPLRISTARLAMTAGGTKLKDAIRQLPRLEFAVIWLTPHLVFTGQIILIILIAWGMVGRSLGL